MRHVTSRVATWMLATLLLPGGYVGDGPGPSSNATEKSAALRKVDYRM